MDHKVIEDDCMTCVAAGLADLMRVLTEYDEGAGPKEDLLEDADDSEQDASGSDSDEEPGSGSDDDGGAEGGSGSDDGDDGAAADFGRLVDAAGAPEVGLLWKSFPNDTPGARDTLSGNVACHINSAMRR